MLNAYSRDSAGALNHKKAAFPKKSGFCYIINTQREVI